MSSPPSISCGYSSVGAAAAVETHLSRLADMANDTLNEALAAADELSSVTIVPTPINVTMDDLGSISTAQPQPIPDIEEITFDVESLDDFDEHGVPPAPSLGTEPTPPSAPPLPPTRTPPTLLELTDIPAPALPALEDAPEYTAVENPVPLPTLVPLQLPVLPDIEDIEFDGIRPITVPASPNVSFAFEETEYNSALATEIRDALSLIFDGGTGLPAAAAEMLRSRAYAAEDENAERAIQSARDEFASMGYALPSAMLIARINRARQDNQNNRSRLSREIYLKEVDTRIDMLKVALSTSVALEEILVRLHISVQDRKLLAARTVVEMAVELMNADIARANAEIAVEQLRLAEYRERIQGQMAKLQLYSEQLRGQELLGRLNETSVRLYVEGFRVIESNVSVYRALVDGYNAKINARRSIVDLYKARVEAETAKIDGNRAEVQAFAELIRADGLVQENYKTRAEVYSAAVQGYSAQAQVKIERYRGELQAEELRIRAYLAQVEGYRALLETERTRITAVAANNNATLEAYQISTQATISRNEAIIRKALALLEGAKAEAQVALQNGIANQENALNTVNLLLRAKETAAQVYSNLAAATTSAINVNASINDSASTSQGCSQSVNYSTEF